jgi:hypothetical protein
MGKKWGKNGKKMGKKWEKNGKKWDLHKKSAKSICSGEKKASI